MDVLSALSITNWVLVLLGAFIIGLSKAGLKGIDIMNITIMAFVFGGKASTGIVLPLICAADVLAVTYYHRHAEWRHFWRLMPWMIVGILVGVFVGKDLEELIFRRIMAVTIALTVFIMLVLEIRKTIQLPKSKMFAASLGLSAGFATMLGNLAGAFSNLYFLAMRIPKNNFIGTSAWVFLVINYFKLPFQIIYWKNITLHTLKIDLLLLPVLLIGFWAGIKIVSKIRDASYRKVVMVIAYSPLDVCFC
jgi:uncharacterized protein